MVIFNFPGIDFFYLNKFFYLHSPTEDIKNVLFDKLLLFFPFILSLLLFQVGMVEFPISFDGSQQIPERQIDHAEESHAIHIHQSCMTSGTSHLS